MNPQLLALLAGQLNQQQDPTQSLNNSILQLNNMLTARQQQENNLPQNAPMQQAQTQQSQGVQQLLSLLQNSPMNNESQRPQLPAFEAQSQQALQNAQQLMQGAKNPAQQAYYAQKAQNAAGENALWSQFKAPMNPDEQAQAKMQRLQQLQALISGTPRTPINDPQLLAGLGQQLGAVGAAGANAAGAKAAGAASAIGAMAQAQEQTKAQTEAAKIQAQGNLDATRIQGQAHVDAAKAGAQGTVMAAQINKGLNGGMTEEQQKILNNNIQGYSDAVNNLGALASSFNDNNANTAAYKNKVIAGINQINELTYGKGNAPDVKKDIEGGYVFGGSDTGDIGTRLAQNITQARIKLQLHQQVMQAALNNSSIDKPGTKGYGQLLDKIMTKIPPQQFQQEMAKTYSQFPQLDPNPQPVNKTMAAKDMTNDQLQQNYQAYLQSQKAGQ